GHPEERAGIELRVEDVGDHERQQELWHGGQDPDRERVLDGVPEIRVVDQQRVVVESDEVRDRRKQVPVGERDVRGVAEREESEDTEDEEEGGDEEVRRELRVEPTQKLAARATGRDADLAWTSSSGYRAHELLLVIVSSRLREGSQPDALAASCR